MPHKTTTTASVIVAYMTYIILVFPRSRDWSSFQNYDFTYEYVVPFLLRIINLGQLSTRIKTIQASNVYLGVQSVKLVRKGFLLVKL